MGSNRSKSLYTNESKRPHVVFIRCSSIWDYFRKEFLVGRGSFAHVFAAAPLRRIQIIDQNKDNSQASKKSDLIALKLFSKKYVGDHLNTDIVNEVLILRTLQSCRYSPRLHGTFEDNLHVSIVTELCSGISLSHHLYSGSLIDLEECFQAKLLKNILLAVSSIHSYNICHLDLKPEHIIIEDSIFNEGIKLIDFGCSKITHCDNGTPLKYSSFTSTLQYAAPEIARQYTIVEGVDLKAIDMWSLGVISVLICSGNLPFNGPNDTVIRDNIFNCNLKVLDNLELSVDHRSFIKGLLSFSPHERMTCMQALNHRWITNRTDLA